jgi:hypothetical protein
MVGEKAMNQDVKVSDRLSLAIDEFREELLAWIETELVRLQERTADAPTDRALAELNADRKASVSPADPRERLDTLARSLDRRIKHARGAIGSGSGKTMGLNAGLNVDSAEPSAPERRR